MLFHLQGNVACGRARFFFFVIGLGYKLQYGIDARSTAQRREGRARKDDAQCFIFFSSSTLLNNAQSYHSRQTNPIRSISNFVGS